MKYIFEKINFNSIQYYSFFYKRFAIFFLLSFSSLLYAAPKSVLWSIWEKHNIENQSVISHQIFNKILNKYLDIQHVSKIHLFDYSNVTKEDEKKLSKYIESLEKIVISNYNRKEQKAYWINLYNALTIQVVLQHYPVKSITKIGISPGWFSFGPWDAKLLKIEGEKVSLNDIEHRILRPIWKDHRIHYAVNCASIGCPNLSKKVYTSNNLEAQLEKATKEYINHPRGVTFEENELIVSSIFKWYQEDFAKNEKELIEYFKKYANSKLLKQLNEWQGNDIDYEYDWNLNKK